MMGETIFIPMTTQTHPNSWKFIDACCVRRKFLEYKYPYSRCFNRTPIYTIISTRFSALYELTLTHGGILLTSISILETAIPLNHPSKLIFIWAIIRHHMPGTCLSITRKKPNCIFSTCPALDGRIQLHISARFSRSQWIWVCILSFRWPHSHAQRCMTETCIM